MLLLSDAFIRDAITERGYLRKAKVQDMALRKNHAMARQQAKRNKASTAHSVSHVDPWYPSANDNARPPVHKVESEPRRQTPLRTLITAKMRSWSWGGPAEILAFL